MDIIILWAQTYLIKVCRFGQRGGRESNNLVFDILLSGNPWRFLALNNPLPYLPPMHKMPLFFLCPSLLLVLSNPTFVGHMFTGLPSTLCVSYYFKCRR